MGIMMKLSKGITLQQLDRTITRAMQNYARSSNTIKGFAKKEGVILSAKNRIAETPFIEMDLRYNAAYKGLRGKTSNQIYADGSTITRERFYDRNTGNLVMNSQNIEFANNTRRTYQETFGKKPSTGVCSWHLGKDGVVLSERNYGRYIDNQGRQISYVNYINNMEAGFKKPLYGTFHIDNQKIHFERIKNTNGELTEAYRAQINNGGKIETLEFANKEELAKHLGVSETCFWGA